MYSDRGLFLHYIRDILQVDWPWIAEWGYADIFAVAIKVQNQDQFWVSHQKINGRFFLILSKSQKMSSYGQNGVLDNFNENSIVLQ